MWTPGSKEFKLVIQLIWSWKQWFAIVQQSMNTSVRSILQKKSFEGVLQSRSSCKFCNIHRKTPVLESLFNNLQIFKACDVIKKRLQHRCFPVNAGKLLRTACFIEHIWWMRLIIKTLENIYDRTFHENV